MLKQYDRSQWHQGVLVSGKGNKYFIEFRGTSEVSLTIEIKADFSRALVEDYRQRLHQPFSTQYAYWYLTHNTGTYQLIPKDMEVREVYLYLSADLPS